MHNIFLTDLGLGNHKISSNTRKVLLIRFIFFF